ncbi:MAG TPA: alanine racemase, partial [Bacillota bacterium]
AACRAAGETGRAARLHVKIDSGMGRLGFPAWEPDTPRRILEAAGSPGVEVEGIYTHFACADEPDDTYTVDQLRAFQGVLDALARGGLRPAVVHAANSAAALRRPETRYNLVRIGLAVYGLVAFPGVPEDLRLRPALRWVTRVAQVKTLAAGIGVSYGRAYVPDRPLRVAVLPVGYADGYDRRLSNRGEVLVAGRRARVLGRVCMDQVVVGPVAAEVRPGDEVVLIGRQGGDEVSAIEMAGWLDTIPYEVITRIGPRVTRLYHGVS